MPLALKFRHLPLPKDIDSYKVNVSSKNGQTISNIGDSNPFSLISKNLKGFN
jgi:hypothetical protein